MCTQDPFAYMPSALHSLPLQPKDAAGILEEAAATGSWSQGFARLWRRVPAALFAPISTGHVVEAKHSLHEKVCSCARYRATVVGTCLYSHMHAGAEEVVPALPPVECMAQACEVVPRDAV